MGEVYLNDPAGNNRDKVRLLIGDRSATNTELTNNEIDNFLEDANDNTTLAAIMACDALIAIYGLKVNKKIADQSVNYSDLQEHFIKLKEQLQKRYDSGDYGIAAPTSGDAEAISRFTSNQFDFS